MRFWLLALVILLFVILVCAVVCSQSCSDDGCIKHGMECDIWSDAKYDCCGFCWYHGYDEYLCTKKDCVLDEDCIDHSTAGEVWCCREKEHSSQEFSFCDRMDPGYTCGDRLGECGDSCAEHGFTACNYDNNCLTGGTTNADDICSHGCETDADCSDCKSPVGMNCQIVCVEYTNGNKWCNCEQ